MPRYKFNVIDGTTYKDDTGTDLPDDACALAEGAATRGRWRLRTAIASWHKFRSPWWTEFSRVADSRSGLLLLQRAFSRRTPLNFLFDFFTSMNSPVALSRLVH
jgi:hypothetical protein